MSRISAYLFIVAAACAWLPSLAHAHFQALIPSQDIVTEKGSRVVSLDIVFTHPMEWGPIMPMGPPRQFGVHFNNTKHDLRNKLKPVIIESRTTYKADYTIPMPADYIFYIEPAPYWEPAEQKMIIHYTKVVVDAFGAEEGWDTLVGFPVEIEPLVRPYGLWTGNTFRGIVKKGGVPVPFAEIEVEYYNENRQVIIPADPYITQVIKADGQGVFSYTMPRAGWWAFAALVAGEEKINNPSGTPVEVELGGLLWVRTRDMQY